MCGVIGYVGDGANANFLYNCLKKLEYRGYDSSGLAAFQDNILVIHKSIGKLSALEPKLIDFPLSFPIGIGHTRWATHGKPTIENAHPHTSGCMVLLHNGIIENYLDIKIHLEKKGYVFLSDTDTESAVHLLNYEYQIAKSNNKLTKMKTSFVKMLSQLKGAYAFVIMNTEIPDCLFVAKLGSPLIIAKGETYHFVASGMTAVVDHSKSVVVLEDGDIGIIKKESFSLFDISLKTVSRTPISIDWNSSMMEKDGYKHYMLKEIHEHPVAIANTLTSIYNKELKEFNYKNLGIKNIDLNLYKRIIILACGSSYISGLLAKYYIENWIKIPVDVELASEFRYRNPFVCQNDLVIAISQSGETADTIQAIKLAKIYHPYTLAIVNVPGSSLSYITDSTLLMNAGPEIGVASTKSFSCQIVTLMVLGLAISKDTKKLSHINVQHFIDDIIKLPFHMLASLDFKNDILEIAKSLVYFKSILFLGRGPNWALALEGALKLKELSYIHAEGFPGGELKHGPIALIDEASCCVVIAPQDSYRSKIFSNIQEIKARCGQVVVIGQVNDTELIQVADKFLAIPVCPEIANSYLITIVLHVLAYWVAETKGTDVDQPRNLAKSVTVE